MFLIHNAQFKINYQKSISKIVVLRTTRVGEHGKLLWRDKVYFNSHPVFCFAKNKICKQILKKIFDFFTGWVGSQEAPKSRKTFWRVARSRGRQGRRLNLIERL